MDDKPRYYILVLFKDGGASEIVGLNREVAGVDIIRMAPKNDGTDSDQQAVVQRWTLADA